MVGDVIHCKWVGGSQGASPWDTPMNSLNPSFDYTVITADDYSYQCNIHGSVMPGSFTATFWQSNKSKMGFQRKNELSNEPDAPGYEYGKNDWR